MTIMTLMKILIPAGDGVSSSIQEKFGDGVSLTCPREIHRGNSNF